MHIRRKYRMPNTIEVQEFNSHKCPGDAKRKEKTGETPERMKRNNQKRKERECSRMVEKYFNDDDNVMTLTYAEEKRPKDMQECLKHFQSLVAYLRREYAKRFYELFWIRNVEVGPANAWHIHMIVNRIDGTEFLINDWWTAKFGGVYNQYLKNLTAQGADIGQYMAKTPFSTQMEEEDQKGQDKKEKKPNGHRVVQTSWNHSRNIRKVQPEDKIISGHSMHDEPRCPKGWYMDKDSYYEGENADGYPYRTYTFRRIKKRRHDRKMKPSLIRRLKARAGKRKKKHGE